MKQKARAREARKALQSHLEQSTEELEFVEAMAGELADKPHIAARYEEMRQQLAARRDDLQAELEAADRVFSKGTEEP